ncbi:hypothetical protein ABW21_db0204617 [Orbilia brochopaga]|nr:hypothetical protein ABW21_db0204617 [Drechslerella brochopaga]
MAGSVSPAYPKFLDTVGAFHDAFSAEHNLGVIRIMQPSCKGVALEVAGLREHKAYWAENLNELLEKWKARGMEAPAGDVRAHEVKVARHDADLERLVSQNRSFGTVTATSGYRVDPTTRHALDWGLFEIISSRPAQNRLPQENSFIKSWYSVKGLDIRGIADPEEGEEVVKFGAVSGWTFGTINGVKDAVYVGKPGSESREWCITSKHDLVFSDCGDSGSFVINRNFKVVGLVIAGCDHIRTLTYMTPMRLVLEDIKRQTGTEMRVIL